MSMTPFTEDDMNSILIAPDDYHEQHFLRDSRSYSRARQHHRPRKTLSMRAISANNSMISEDSSHGSEDHNDSPSTPPCISKGMFTSPPEVPRLGRPINRRLFMQEAQERLSLPDLFGHRSIPQPSFHRTRMMQHRNYHISRPPSVCLQPRAVSWGDSFEEIGQGHKTSQRSVFGTNPAHL